MSDPGVRRFGACERQRLIRFLLDLQADRKGMNWSSMAGAISDWNGVEYHRQNFYRLAEDKLGDSNIEIIVRWLEATSDPQIRLKLLPDRIFEEVGKAVRDYFFHIPASNNLDEWNEQILGEYEGVYWCAPSWDINSYIPLPVLRKWLDDHESYPQVGLSKRSLNARSYIGLRSLLILKKTDNSYFHAAEIPLSMLFPRTVPADCLKLVYEGVGYVSANSIHVELRECLSRVPKIHAFTIKKKPRKGPARPLVLDLYLPSDIREVRKEWQQLPDEDMEHLKRQYALSLDSGYYLEGSAQISTSPPATLMNRVGSTYSQDYSYHRKPDDFLSDKDTHLLYLFHLG